MKRLPILIQYIVLGIILGISTYLFVEKYRMGMFRYFDMDELAYLNWTAHMVQGSLPYRDFFFVSGPGFLLLLAPIFWIQSSLIAPFFAGRVVAFVVFLLLCLTTGLLFYIMRKRRWTAIFVVFLLVFLPMPADKFLEIRPDTTAILFAMLGTVLQVFWMQKKQTEKGSTLLFFSGLSYGISLCVMQKTFLHVAASGVMVILWAYMHARKSRMFSFRLFLRTIVPFITGGLFIGALLLIWGVATRNVDMLVYSMTKLSMELSNMGKSFPLPPLFFFKYIDVYYGISGWNWGFLLNSWLWVIGLVIGGIRFFWSLCHMRNKEMVTDFFISMLFVIQTLVFIFMLPFKHAQYLIPLAVFVVFYVCDGIDMCWMAAKRSLPTLIVFVCCITLFLFFCIRGYHDVNDIKYAWTNTSNRNDILEVQTIFRTIPKTEYIFDMVGLTLYYPQPYYVSCLPVGQLSQHVTRPFPLLTSTLIASDTKYVYQGGAKRISTLSWEDQHYILSHFTGVGDGSLLVRNDIVETYKNLWNREQK
jgi:hypothetical protein